MAGPNQRGGCPAHLHGSGEEWGHDGNSPSPRAAAGATVCLAVCTSLLCPPSLSFPALGSSCSGQIVPGGNTGVTHVGLEGEAYESE